MATQGTVVTIAASVTALLLGSTVLLSAQGMFLLLVPVLLGGVGASPQAVSLVGSAYFVGFVLGAWVGDRLIHRVGHIRAYAGMIALILIAALSLPLVPTGYGWAGVRMVHGIAISGTLLAVESWLVAAVPDHWRGRVLGIYTALGLAALAAGQLLVSLAGTGGFRPFNIGAVLLAASIIPVVMSRVNSPLVDPVADGSRPSLFHLPIVALIGALGAGMLTGAFWALMPLYGLALGLDTGEISLVMSLAIVGGLLLGWPVGHLSDHTDRRLVILGAALVGAVDCVLLFSLDGAGRPLLYAMTALFGAVIFSLYPLALSHAADRAPAGPDLLQITRGLLLWNGIGAAMGPVAGGQVFERLGAPGLFAFAAAVSIVVAVVSLWSIRRKSSVPAAERAAHAMVWETTPAALALDPRTLPQAGEDETGEEQPPAAPAERERQHEPVA